MSSGGFEPGLPSLLMQAAQSAAQADGLRPPDSRNAGDLGGGGLDEMAAMQQQQSQPKPDLQAMQRKASLPPTAQGGGGGGGGKKKGPPLRRGKWTPEEEAYANRLIQEFKAGLLPLTDGTTLRTFLSKLLNCDPMRISKKFVGSNCIGKQVFRRRTADLNRLTPEQIQQSRAELSELERRFLERVAQTNRVKSSGVGGGGPAAPPAGGSVGKIKEEMDNANPPSPPWLQPPLGYKHGQGAALAAANLAGGEANSRAAAAGRALLQGLNPGQRKSSNPSMASPGSAGLLAMAELQRRASQQSMLQSMSGNLSGNLSGNPSAQQLLAAAANSSGSAPAGSTMAQMARNASAARMAGLAGSGGANSVNNLMLKTGFSRDQLSQFARERGLSSASLSNLIERQNSFDALMSLDFQSLKSIDNLANLIQTGGSSGNIPESGIKNWSPDTSLAASRQNLAAAAAAGSSGNLSNAARRLASAGQMESLLRSLSGNNMKNSSGNMSSGSMGQAGQNNNEGGSTSNANLSNLLQSMSSMQGGVGGNSMSSLLGSGNAASAVSLANILRENSATGLTALRMQDGLTQRNSSVDDFLSLVAAGDIPHQDPSLLNVPLMHQQANNQGSNGDAAANYLAQQQLLAQAAGNPALANALASRSLSNLRNTSGQGSVLSLKRSILEVDGGGEGQGPAKR